MLLPRGWQWDASIDGVDRDAIVDRILRLPAWADNQLEAQNLDVKKLENVEGLWRLRSGDFRVIFQIVGTNIVVHRVMRRGEDYRGVDRIVLVRSGSGLRVLDTDAPITPVPQTARPIRLPTTQKPVQNALSVFTDAELHAAGLPQAAVDGLRRIPPELLPDAVLSSHRVGPDIARLVAELWNRPGDFVGKPLDVAAVQLSDEEAVRRLASDYSATSLVSVDNPRALLALLEADIEDWMVYLHPSQLAAVRRPAAGASRVRGGAGTGKTVVALHRARHLAEATGGEVLLTTFVNNLPRVWERLLHRLPSPTAGSIRCRTVNQIAVELYRKGGGVREIADESRRHALIHDVWAARRDRVGGLTELGLAEEFDHVIIGRGIEVFDSYVSLPRTGRGTPLSTPMRSAVWEAFEEYALKMGKERLTYWPEIRRDALRVLREGSALLEFDAVVADEAQDLGAAAVQMLAAISGGLPSPNLTLVGDGQQAIYPGGFSLLQMGLDVRGRATVLRTNWRNTYAIWIAAQAFIEGETFDDLEEDIATRPGRRRGAASDAGRGTSGALAGWRR